MLSNTLFAAAGLLSLLPSALVTAIPVLSDPRGQEVVAELQRVNGTVALNRRAETVACRYNDECSAIGAGEAGERMWCNTRIRLCTKSCDWGYTLSPWTKLCVKNKGKPATSSSTTLSPSTPTTTPAPSSTSAPATAGRSCSLTVQCAGLEIPASSHQWCDSKAGVCSWRCNSGYTAKGGACLKNVGSAATPSSSPNAPAAPAPVPTTTPSQPSTTVAPSPSSTKIPVAWSSVDTSTLTATSTTTSSAPTASANPYLVDVDLSDISAFNANTLGWNTNSLISWYHTDSSADSTNGHSWCYIPYSDATPGFAPSLNTMLAEFDWDPILAGQNMCGLEAEIITPDGRSAILYLHDAFDDQWVRTPNAIDVIYDSFALLWGKVTNNKNDVVKQAQWRFTGKRDTRYTFNGGNPVGNGW